MNDHDMVRAEIWLQEQLKQRPSIESLAQRLGYSVSQVRRNFKSSFGLTPGAYRDRLRLERAAFLLGSTKISVASIAKRCGYYNHSAFSRAFQRQFSCNPRSYRDTFHRQLSRRYTTNPCYFPFSIKEHGPRYALLARHYGFQHESSPSAKWRYHAKTPALEQRSPNNMPIWVIQDHPDITQDKRIRIDYGLLIESDTAAELAPPLPFRIVELPACRTISLIIDTLDKFDTAHTFLHAQGLSMAGESLSGEPGTLTWLEGEPGDQRQSRIELDLPLASLS